MTAIDNAVAKDAIHGHRKIKSHLGIRGIAASLVVMYHLSFGIGYHFWFEDRNYLFGRSYLCVDLFFILSGFIISYANRADKLTGMNSSEAKAFFKNRFARIYPLHFVCLYALVGFTLIISVMDNFRGLHDFEYYWPPEQISALLAQTLLLQSAGPASWASWNIPSWSISAELFAYLAFVPMICLRARSTRLQMIVLIVCPLLFYGYVLLAGRTLDIVSGLAPVRCLAGFALGMIAFYKRNWINYIEPWVLNLLQAIGLIIATCDLCFGWNDLIAIPAFALMVFTTWSDAGFLSAILSRKPFEYLGTISYSIYLTHIPVIQAISFIWAREVKYLCWMPEPGVRAMFIIVIWAAVYGVSGLAFTFIEGPGRNWVLKRLAFATPKLEPS